RPPPKPPLDRSSAAQECNKNRVPTLPPKRFGPLPQHTLAVFGGDDADRKDCCLSRLISIANCGAR
ncbi:MAG: hypothetical protein MPJ22_07150, partial [Pirellulales bacterium]|nr:hypothetical protein [Pirellulales bacterium]